MPCILKNTALGRYESLLIAAFAGAVSLFFGGLTAWWVCEMNTGIIKFDGLDWLGFGVVAFVAACTGALCAGALRYGLVLSKKGNSPTC